MLKEVNLQLLKLQNDPQLSFFVQTKMGIDFPRIEYQESHLDQSYDFEHTTIQFDQLAYYSNNIFELLLQLAEMESSVEIMISEIEKSKRRVNAIENIVIKEIEEKIRVIRMKLSDLERSNTIRMIKSKEIILNKNEAK